MRYFLRLLVLLTWGLWFGGTIASFIFALQLFHTFADNHELAGQAVGALFLVFGKYELVLAAIAMGCTILMLANQPSPRLIFLFAGLIFSSGMAITFAMGLTPRIESLRKQDKTHTEEFRRLHGSSMIVMTAQSVLLLMTGILLINVLTDPSRAGQNEIG